jgi:cytoskeletal protein CcmA (bactofilin family)
MSEVFAAIIFLLLALALTALPFVPAIVEWRKKTDAEPLSVVYASAVDVRHFAYGFRQFVETHLRGALDACARAGGSERGTLADGTPYVAVGDGDESLLTLEETKARACHHVIASNGDLHLPDRTMFLPEIYADGAVRGGDGGIYRAVLAEEGILLGRGSVSLRWLHSTRTLQVRSGSVLFGRASADKFIRLERGCRFERLNAPRVEFCYQAEAGEFAGGITHRESAILRPRDLPIPVEVKAGRWLVLGGLEIPAGKIVKANLVATGAIRIGTGTHVIGNIKSHKDMHLEKGVEVDGSVVSRRDITLEAGCRIYGPAMAERTIVVGEGVVFGTASRPTTVSAERIFVEPGAVAHGTVWAHTEGRVAAGSPPGGRRESVGAHAREGS